LHFQAGKSGGKSAMPHPPYEVKNFNLATVRNQLPVVAMGPQVETVTILAIPAGVSVSVRMGSASDDIPLLTQGQEISMCPPNSDGVFLTNPAAAGTLSLLIGYSGISVSN
jgi:hypothetical protein